MINKEIKDVEAFGGPVRGAACNPTEIVCGKGDYRCETCEDSPGAKAKAALRDINTAWIEFREQAAKTLLTLGSETVPEFRRLHNSARNSRDHELTLGMDLGYALSAMGMANADGKHAFAHAGLTRESILGSPGGKTPVCMVCGGMPEHGKRCEEDLCQNIKGVWW